MVELLERFSMGFISVDITLDDVLKGIHQDYVYPVLSIHDEVDLLMDRCLKEGIAWNLTKRIECKEIFDKFGFRYINVFFDNEYNEKDGSFAVDSSFSVYDERVKVYKELAKKEGEAVFQGKEVLQKVKGGEVIVVYLSCISEIILKELGRLGKGGYDLFLDVKGERYKYEKQVSLDKEILGKFRYTFQNA